MNGAKYACRGKFDPLGRAELAVVRHSLAPIRFSLQLDFTGAAINGFATNVVGTNTLISVVRADKAANPAPVQGFYPFVLQSPGGGARVAKGDARVGGDGVVRTLGASTEGSRFTLRSTLDQSGESPFYITLKPGGVVILGWLQFGLAGQVSGALYSLGPATNGVSLLEAVPRF
jgi:hypothetical protein